MRVLEARQILGVRAEAAGPSMGRITLELNGAIASITLDNPASKNAFTLDMMCAFFDCVRRLEAWDGAALIVRSAPCGVFCAGGHLKEVRAHLLDKEGGEAMSVVMTDALDRLAAAPFLSIAVVDGLAIGGGAELLTAMRCRLLSPTAAVEFAHARLGIAPGWGATGRLLQHVGRSNTSQILLEARRFSSAEAMALGLATEVVHRPEGRAMALAKRAASRCRSTRAIIAQVNGLDEGSAFLQTWGEVDHLKALGVNVTPKVLP